MAAAPAELAWRFRRHRALRDGKSHLALCSISSDRVGVVGVAANAVLGAVTFCRFLTIFSTGVGRAMDSPVLDDLCSVMVRSSLHLVS
jgi:hypothetical protein